MTESVVGMAPQAQAAVQAGALLRQAREATGLHVAALAVALKVPVGKVEALEAGRLDLLPDAVFARALAASICRTLKVDPAPILEHLPAGPVPRLKTDESGINAPFHPGSTAPAGPRAWFMTRPAWLVAAALLLGSAVLLLLPRLQREGPAARTDVALPPGAASSTTDTRPSAPQPAAATAPGPVGALTSPPAASPMAAPPAQPAGITAPLPGQPAAVAASMAPAAAPSAAAAAPLAAGTPAIVAFQTRGPTWVQVIDANGVVALRKTLAGGEAASASGALPLSVVIGRADATEVQVRGKPLDLAPLARDNVARFEVK